MRRQPAAEPGLHVVRQRKGVQRRHRQCHAAALLVHGAAPCLLDARRQDGEGRLVVLRQQRVEIDEVADAFRHAVGDAGHREAAEGVAHEDHVLQLLRFQHRGDVLHEGVDGDGARHQVPALAEPGLGRREDAVALGTQPVRGVLPDPAAAPGAMHQDKGLGSGGRGLRQGGGSREGDGPGGEDVATLQGVSPCRWSAQMNAPPPRWQAAPSQPQP
jgi:hypothetical protein